MNWDGDNLHVVIDSPTRCEFCKQLDAKIIFESDIINYLPCETKLVDILVNAELFPSKNEARKNWQYGFELEEGFSFDKYTALGKKRKNIYILNVPANIKHGECDKDESREETK